MLTSQIVGDSSFQLYDHAFKMDIIHVDQTEGMSNSREEDGDNDMGDASFHNDSATLCL